MGEREGGRDFGDAERREREREQERELCWERERGVAHDVGDIELRGGSYRSTLLTRNRAHLEPYSRTMPMVLGGGRFLMSEVPLQGSLCRLPRGCPYRGTSLIRNTHFP